MITLEQTNEFKDKETFSSQIKIKFFVYLHHLFCTYAIAYLTLAG